MAVPVEDYRSLAIGASGTAVQALQARLLDRGSTIATEELAEGMFGPSTRTELMEVQQQRGLLWVHGTLDAPTMRLLDAEPDHGTYWVAGRVLEPDGRPAAGLVVRAFDRDLRGEQPLGEAQTDDHGFYLLRYTAEAFAKVEQRTADVFVRVFDGRRRLTDPPMDQTRFNAPRLVSVVVRLAAERTARQTRLERIEAAVAPLLGDVRWTDLAEDGEHADATFLTGETGLPHEWIEHAIVAHRLSARYEAPVGFFYALFATDALLSARTWSTFTPRLRIDLATPLTELLYDVVLLPQDAVRADVELAVRGFLVPADVLERLDETLKALDRYRGEAREHLVTARQQAVLGRLQGVLTSPAREEVLALLAEDPFGDFGSIIARLHRAGGMVADVQVDAELARLILAEAVGDAPAVIEHLHEKHAIATPGDGHKLAEVDQAQWAAAIRAGSPDASDETVQRQARALMQGMAARHPTTAFAARLATDPASPIPHADAVADVLKTHPDFDLATGNVNRLLSSTRITTTAQARAALRSAQRVFKIAPRYEQTSALLASGVASAAQVHAQGRTRFMATALATGEFTESQAQRAFHAASDLHSASVVLAGQLASASSAGAIAALADGAELDTPQADLIEQVTKDFPNFQSLFLQGDMCQCTDCRSVHGAAAYLVDALEFVRNRLVVDTTAPPPQTPTKVAKDVLFERRPDLGDLDLSCPNTDTPLPYLDVVCELLEDAVAPDAGVPYSGAPAQGVADAGLVSLLQAQGWAFTEQSAVFGPDLAGCFVVRDAAAVAKLTPDGGNWRIRRLRQTFGSAEQVGAAPEYLNDAAYAALVAADYAFALPFDLAHQETRAYFAQFDLDRSDLVRLLDGTEIAVAAEALGCSDAQRALVTTPKPGGQQAIWNTPTVQASATLKNVDRFVTRAGIEFTDLVELLDLDWIDGGLDLFVRSLDNTCDLAAKEIVHLNDTAVDRLHRFLRLRPALGWSSATLDRAIRSASVGKGKLDDPCLVRMSLLAGLSADLRLTQGAVLDLLDPLDPSDPDGTYWRTLLDPSAVGTVDAQFDATSVAANEAAEAGTPGSGVKLSAHADFLALALGNTPADTALLMDFAGADPALTRASVSRAYAGSRLARAVRLPVADLVALVAVTGTDPLASLAALRSFVDVTQTLAAAGMPVGRLSYLLRHEAPAGSDLTAYDLAPSVSPDLLSTVDSAYAKAKTATASPVTAGGTPLENAGKVHTQLAALPGLTATDLATLQTLLVDAWVDTTVTEAAFVDAVLAPFAPFIDTTPIKAALATRAAAADPKDAAQNAALTVIADEVSGYLYRQARLEALTAAVAAALGIPAERVDVLLGHAHLRQPGSAGNPLLLDVLLDDATTAAAVDLKQRAVQLLHMIVTISPEDATDEDVAWLLDNAEALGWLEWDALPYDTVVPDATYEQWAKTQAFFDLVALYPAVANTADPANPFQVRTLFDVVLAGTSTAADVLNYLAALAGLDAATLIALDTQLGLSTPDLTGYRDPATITGLTDTAAVLRQLGLDVPTAVAVSKPTLTLADAKLMRAALKTRYADADWLPVLKQVQGPLRERRRDALVAYLLATNPDLRDATDLYDHFLIDVEMGACMDTSRIVQAHATVQLFVMRCLMGLEPTSVASVGTDDGWKQWDWMANFRVWEANRKIFLWPENWIAPDLRDDKTELFIALDNQLQQNPLTDDAIEDAATTYLEGLDDIAHIDVMAAHYMTTTKTLHVFARTKGGDPTAWLHREFQEERYWTPWTTVPLDIAGDHLLAFDRNNRLTLAWPIFTSEADQTKQPPDTPDPASLSGGKPNSLPDKRWSIQLAVSELSGDTWRPKKVSKGAITTGYQQNLPDDTSYNFFVWGLGTGQAVTCVGPSGTVGSFALTGCKGYPEPTSAGGFNGPLLPAFKDTALQANRFAELNQDATNDLAELSLLDLNGTSILNQTPGLFTVTHPMQMTIVDWVLLFLEVLALSKTQHASLLERGPAVPLGTLMPWFYGDYDRTYVVVPGFYEREKPREVPGQPASTNDEIRKTFSDVFQLVTDIVALIAKYVQHYQEDPSQPVADLVHEFLADPETLRIRAEFEVYRQLRYGLRFANFYHPLVCLLRSTLNTSGIPAIMDRDLQLTDTGFSFAGTYQPTGVVVAPYPRENFDFELDGAYSAYNWELFFHLPFDIAKRLSTDGQYDEARDWYHYIFDPVGATDAPVPRRYWKTKPFFLTTPAEYVAQRIDSIMNAIAADPSGATIGDLAFAVSSWRDDPFKPDVVARSRPVAYQIAIVANYAQLLVDDGDSLFRQFTRESITAATQKYVLAQKLLGRKPRVVPPVVEPPPYTYNQLEAEVDLFGNALLDLENLVPDLGLLPHGGAELPPNPATFASLYFCIPPNENLLNLWDVVEDRLLKIRTCRNIEGVQASLALFSPPIDPGALVRAAAAGLDISAFVAGLGAPLPHYRFHVMAQKAGELATQVASLGIELLSVLEKRDAEKMARLRADHEVSTLAAMRTVKVAGLAEAQAAVVALRLGRDVVQKRYDFYSSRDYMNVWEGVAVGLAGASLLAEVGVTIANALAGGLKLVPTFTVGGAGFGGSPVATVATGGQSFGGSAESAASVLGAVARIADKGASMAATQGGYQRRQDDWDLQTDLAQKELTQIDQQIANATLHVDTLTKDLAAHDVQAANAESARALMHSKYTNQELYEWMLGKVSSVYYSAYKLAFDTAKKAERCFNYELGTDTSYIGFGYWDSLKKGLMTHQALIADIKRMETAYFDANVREYELTKHISLAELDPGALMALKINGSATIQVPELVYAVDHPSHYFRRIKSVAMSLVCSAGPYTTVAATLSLVSNKYRKSTAERQGAATDKDKYAEDPGNDPRFAYNVGSMASVATSTAVSDSGTFELNFHDERYLPFEGAGAAGTWQVQLPTVLAQLDRDTISDLVLHVRYTAREGGSTFRTMVEKAMIEVSNEVALTLGRSGWWIGLSVRDQFPDAWWQLQQTGSTQVTVGVEHLPFAVRSLHPTIAATTIAARVTGAPASYAMTVDGTPQTLNRDPLMKPICKTSAVTATLGSPLSLAANTTKLEDLILLVHYTITA